jgi:O-succinylhomoserine sulfhydrylase
VEIDPMSPTWRPQTRLVHGGTNRSPHGETSEALFLTSGFSYEVAEDAEARFAETQEGYTYSRVGNPTVRMLEERMALLEGSEDCAATASGMAAVHAALMCQLRAGMRVVGSALLFGSCHWILTQLCPRFGIEVELVDGKDLDAWERAFRRPADLVFLESPGNPTLELVDLAAVSELAHRAGAQVIVDNVFATPLLQQPLQLGADLVVYSGTKHIDGQGRCLGGLICCATEFRKAVLHPYLRNTGPGLSPFNAWVLLKGLETLTLRVRAMSEAAARLAHWLEGHARVRQVLYPGLESFPQHELARRQMKGGGSLIAFRVGGGRAQAFDVLNRLRLIRISNNLGDAKSLMTHPSSTTHSKIAPAERVSVGITEDLLRLSVGLEDLDDLIADLDHALAG